MIEAAKKWVGLVARLNYPLRAFLGASEHTAVFLTQLGLDPEQKAAIKIIPADAPNARIQRSRWERAVRLPHFRLLRLFETGECTLDGTLVFYAVTEFADENLSQILAFRPLNPHEARQALKSILEALVYLHSRGIVHARLKPSNIVLVQGQIKLTFDGLATVGETRDTLGPVSPYDPPEAAAGLASTAGDIWALGMILVETLSLELPAWQTIWRGDPVIPDTIREPFLDIARHCLRRNPHRRWTASEIATRLQLTPALPLKLRVPEPPPRPSFRESLRDLWLRLPSLPRPTLRLPSFRFPSFHLPAFRLPKLNLPAFRMPAFRLPKPNLPAFHLPAFHMPKLNRPAFRLPSFRLPSFRFPKLKLPSFRMPTFRVPKLNFPAFRMPAFRRPSLRLPTFSLPDLHLRPLWQRTARWLTARTEISPSLRRPLASPRILVPSAILFLAFAAILVVPRLLTEQPQAQPSASHASGKTPPASKAARKTAASRSSAKPAGAVATSPASRPPAPPVPAPTLPVPSSPASVAPRTPSPTAALSATGTPRGAVLQQILPAISQNALNTVRGTVRISVKVKVSPSGQVLDAEFVSPGPSKTFAALALDAARRWQFTAPSSGGQPLPSEWLILFQITQSGVSALPQQSTP